MHIALTMAFSLGLLLPAINSFAQSVKPIIRSLATEDGLSHNYVYRVLQDREGAMWFATNYGLNRYDGAQITVFTHDVDNDQSIAENDIADIAEDSNGDLWIALKRKGVDKYDVATETFIHYPLNAFGYSIFPDQDGGVWFGTEYGLMYKAAEKEEFTPYSMKPHPFGRDFTKNIITDIHQDKSGRLFFANENGLYLIDQKQNKEQWILPCSSYPYNKDAKFLIKCLTEDNKGNLYIGTFEGIFSLAPNDTCLQTFFHKAPDMWTGEEIKIESLVWADSTVFYAGIGNYGLYRIEFDVVTQKFDFQKISTNNGFITGLQIDHSGILWAGTVAHGVQIYDPKANKFKWIVPTENTDLGLNESYVNIVREDSKGIRWLGTVTGLSFIYPPGQKALFPERSYEGNKRIGSIHEISEAPDGHFWIGMNSGIRRFGPNGGKPESFFDVDPEQLGGPQANIVTADLIDHNGNYWAGFWGGGVAVYREGRFLHYSCKKESIAQLQNCYVQGLLEDRQGAIWIALAYNGLQRLDPVSNATQLFEHDENNPNSLSHNYVRTLLEDQFGNIWVGTYGGGLNKLDPQTGLFKHYRKKDGLPEDLILDLLQDTSGYIWVLTNRAISKFDPEAETFLNFGYEDGLPKTRFNRVTYGTVSGEILLASNDGVVSFKPEGVGIDTVPPKITIRSLERFRKDSPDGEPVKVKGISRQKSITFDHKDDLVSFEFAVLHYRKTKLCQLAYRLEGLHNDWIQLGNRRQITFSSLAPGQYTLIVKAANADGIWNENPLELPILVRPPWWKSTWAYAFYILASLLVLYYLRKYEMNRMSLQNELKNKEMEATKMKELDEAKSRFFANISHELRTPLTVIIGQSDRIEQPLGIRAIIQRNSKKLLQLINQILDLAKLDSGKLELSLTHGDIIHYLRYITESLTSLAQSKGLELIFYQEVEEVLMDFDEDKIQGILSNLLSNAIKFTPTGGKIFVHVNQISKESGDLFIIKVKDTGIGIESERLPNIFDRFYQVDNSMVRKNEGTGIGLAYVSDLVNLMGGNISVKSKLNHGTEFQVQLPIHQNLRLLKPKEPISSIPEEITFIEGQTPVAADSPHSKESELPIALLVEDNQDVTAYLERCLEGSYELHSASNGRLGLEKAIEVIPDVIVSDVMMPEMNGFDMCIALKKDERTSHIPVVLLTAKADTTSRIEGFEKGADAYLAKPFHKKELRVRLKQLLEVRKQLQERYGSLENNSNLKAPTEDAFLQKIQKEIEAHLSDADFTVMHLCQKIRLSQPQLYRKVKALTGKSIASYMRSVRLHKAKEMLQTTALNVSEVAYEVGFTEPSYFSRSFLEEFGFSPSELHNQP